MPPRRLPAAMFVVGFLATMVSSADADTYDIGSLAPQFLQSKTRMSVLDRDDKADSVCKEKNFVKAVPVREPEKRVVGGITERIWREIWTVARCGTQVYYMIFFTEEGSGGASYGIVGPDALAEIEKYRDAQPAAAPPSQDFLVYFDSNQTKLRSDATRTLEMVVQAGLKRGIPRVVLTGHADTVGGSAYNQKLSERRALTVETYLVRRGIPVADITTAGKGKGDLRISTPDQVRAQENRNVHIEIE